VLTLPTERTPATITNPKQLILFGLPKSGKTSILTYLDDCLIIDIDGGTGYYDAMSLPVKTLEDLSEIRKALIIKKKETGRVPYKYIALDTITTLGELIIPLAGVLYKKTAMGKSYKGDDVRTLPNGAGYMYVRKAFISVIESFQPLCDNIIYTAHVREKLFEKRGNEFTATEVDLEGKLRTIIPGRCDSIGYVYRKKNETYISFLTSESVVCGSRSNHLKNKEIMIAKSADNININETHWDKIYLPHTDPLL